MKTLLMREALCISLTISLTILVKYYGYGFDCFDGVVHTAMLVVGCYIVVCSALQWITKLYCAPYQYNCNSSNSKPEHLIVIVGGYLGFYARFKGIQTLLSQHMQQDSKVRKSVMIYVSRSNHSRFLLWLLYKHNDGVENGALRLSHELVPILRVHSSINDISFIGCSLGGLYARYCLKLLSEHHGSQLTMKNFITLASPHCGVEDVFKEQAPQLYRMAQNIHSYGLLPRTLKQLFLFDALLVTMATHESFLVPLQKFSNRVCFGNGKFDKLVSFSSSLLLHGARQKKWSLELWDQMTSQNNEFLIQQLEEREIKNKDDDEHHCWFDPLRFTVNWKKFAVCWNHDHWTRKNVHPLLAAPFVWHDGCKQVCSVIHQHFQY